MISYITNLSAKVETCDKVKFQTIVGSETVKRICKETAALANSILEEERKAEPDMEVIKQMKELMQQTKRQLPAFLFQASFPNGRRLQNEARLTGLYMCDFDHVLNDKLKINSEKFSEDFSSLIKTFGILLIHVTPSGQGLRIVAKANPKIGNIADNQEALAKAMGLPLDKACKDASRISYAVPSENIIYLDDELFTYENKEYDEMFGNMYHLSEELKVKNEKYNSLGNDGSEHMNSSLFTFNSSLNRYRGVEYSKIIAEWWKQKGGEPVDGERNVKLHQLAANLRYVCDNRVDNLIKVMPTFGLSVHEMETICKSACGKEMLPCIPREFRNVLSAVEIETKEDDKEMEQDVETLAMSEFQSKFDKLKLPPVLKAVCSGVSKKVRIGAVMASLPMFYTLLTRVRFQHFDGSENRLSGMTFVIGPAASGKSFILDLDKLLMKPIRDNDKVQRALEEQYLKDKEAAKNNPKQPERKKYCIRIVPVQVSNTKLAQRMRDAATADDFDEKLHCYSVEAELATAIRASRGGTWIEKNDIYCKSFHNEYWGMDYANDQAINGEIQVNYNLVISGTEDAFDKLIPTNTVLSGLPTRLMYFPMPSERFKMIKRKQSVRSKAEQTLLKEVAHDLYNLNLREVDASPIADAMYEWCSKVARDAELAKDEELDDLRKRTALIGGRAGVAYAIIDQLEEIKAGKVLRFNKRAIEFALFFADFCLHTQYMKFASRMREQKQRAKLNAGKKERPVRLSEEYKMLPETFTIDDFHQIRPNANKPALRICCKRWVEKGYLKKADDKEGAFVKLFKEI